MGYALKQGQTARPLLFPMFDATDGTTPETGLSPTVTISKNGGAFASPAGAVTEVGVGWYKVAGNATDSNTLGPLVLHATATGAAVTDVLFEVVAYDPADAAALGLSRLDATVGSRATQTSVDTIDDLLDTEMPALTAAVAAVQADTDNLQTRIPAVLVGGRIDASIGAVQANAITAAGLDPDVTTELQSGLATAAALNTVDDFLDTEIAAIKAKTDNLPASPANEATLTTISGLVDDIETRLTSARAGYLDKLNTGVPLDLTQAVNYGAAADTLGRAIAAMIVNGVGRESLVGTTYTLMREDGTTFKTFTVTIDGSGNITARA